ILRLLWNPRHTQATLARALAAAPTAAQITLTGGSYDVSFGASLCLLPGFANFIRQQLIERLNILRQRRWQLDALQQVAAYLRACTLNIPLRLQPPLEQLALARPLREGVQDEAELPHHLAAHRPWQAHIHAAGAILRHFIYFAIHLDTIPAGPDDVGDGATVRQIEHPLKLLVRLAVLAPDQLFVDVLDGTTTVALENCIV